MIVARVWIRAESFHDLADGDRLACDGEYVDRCPADVPRAESFQFNAWKCSFPSDALSCS